MISRAAYVPIYSAWKWRPVGSGYADAAQEFEKLIVVNTWSENLTAAQNSYTFPASGTWTPNANEMVFVGVGTRKIVGPATTPATLTGTGGWNVTWTALDDLLTGGSTLARATTFWGITSDAGAGNLTVDYGGTNQAQCGVVAQSGANIDFADFTPRTDQGTSIDGSIGILDFSSTSAQVGYMVFGVARGTPSAFVPETGVHVTSLIGGVLGMMGLWVESLADLRHVGDFTSGSNSATLLFMIPVTGRGMGLGQTRNMLVF